MVDAAAIPDAGPLPEQFDKQASVSLPQLQGAGIVLREQAHHAGGGLVRLVGAVRSVDAAGVRNLTFSDKAEAVPDLVIFRLQALNTANGSNQSLSNIIYRRSCAFFTMENSFFTLRILAG